MALLLPSSSPSRRQGLKKRRSNSVFTILLLVLSHSIWDTLQCGTSSPNKNLASDNSFENELGSNEFSGGQSAVEKKDVEDRQVQPQNERACGDRLLQMIVRICGADNFYAPGIGSPPTSTSASNSLNEILGVVSKRSEGEIMQRRLTRSLANECCKNPCPPSSMYKFCADKDRMPAVTTQKPEPEVTTTEEQVEDPQEPEVQLSPSSEEPDPANYYPILHIIKFLRHQLRNKNFNPRLDGEVSVLDNQQLPKDTTRELPIPQARIQQNRHSRPRTQTSLRVSSGVHSNKLASQGSSREQNRRKGIHSPSSIGGVIGSGNYAGGAGVSFTNTASYRQGHPHHPSSGGGGSGTASGEFARQLSEIKKYLHHRQVQGQQSTRRPHSTNLLTSTIAPDVTIFPLGPSSYDDIPYSK